MIFIFASTCELGLPPIVVVSRWYFRRAPNAYRAETTTYTMVNAAVAETERLFTAFAAARRGG